MSNLFNTSFPFTWDQLTDGLSDEALGGTGNGITGGGDWTTANGAGDEIITAASRTADGSSGFRHWVGNGSNDLGSGIRATWTGAQEIWIRWYVRFPVGFSWGVAINMKMLYVNYDSGGQFYFGLKDTKYGGHVNIDQITRPGLIQGDVLSSFTWNDWMGGSVGDGQWHYPEVRMKMNTGGNQDGEMQMWLDGDEKQEETDVLYSANGDTDTFNFSKIGENHYDPQSGDSSDQYVDFDDIAVSSVGYIGPASAAPSSVAVGSMSLR